MSYLSTANGAPLFHGPVRDDGDQVGVCEVHRLLDRDVQLRRVRWCSVCSAWICSDCRGNLARRMRAMAMRAWKGMR